MEFLSKKWLVLGAGASGLSAARFLRERGAVVGVYDNKRKDGIPEAIFVNEDQITSEQFDYCVISPGFSINHPIARMFEGRIISELMLGFTAPHKKIVAITGTNGKTTVTNMLGAAARKHGVICGNVGVPVSSVSAEIAKKVAVTEVSSFMMEVDMDFRPDISIILNITQDHLERHGTMDEYIKCKAKLTHAKKVILNYDCLNCRMFNDGRAFYFSTSKKVRGIYLDGKNIVLDIGKRPKVIFDIDEFCEDRPHQISNILAVILACTLLKISRKRILTACMGGKLHEHRMQDVGRIENVAFINDSKATNIAACLAACACFEGPINLLVGGITKGQNMTELFAGLPKQVEHVFAFGEGAEVIINAAKNIGFKNILKFKLMKDAVLAAYKHGFGPRVVLLSPACASFDEFENYADRGRAFAEIVKETANAKN